MQAILYLWWIIWGTLRAQAREIVRCGRIAVRRILGYDATVILDHGRIAAATVIRTTGTKLIVVRMVVRPGTYVCTDDCAIYLATEAGWIQQHPPAHTPVLSLRWLPADHPALISYTATAA